MVQKIGASNIKAFITDSASNAKACGKALEAKYPHIIWMPCAVHCIDLLLEDIGKLDWAAEIIEEGKDVVKYFKAHQWTLGELRQISKVKLELLLPGDTRFGTEFLMVSRAVEKRDDLQATVRSDVWTAHMPKPKKVGARQSGASANASTSKAGRQSKPSQKAAQAANVEAAVLQEKSAAQKAADQVKDVHDAVLDEEMWVKMEFLVDVCKPIIMLLRFCDSDALGISKLYYRCSMLQTWIKACNGDKESIAAIDEYRTSMLKAEKGEKYVVSESDLFVPSFEDMEKMLKLQPGTINKQLMGIVRKRWDMLHTPLHAAAYVLDLEYHGQLDEICNNEEVMSGFEEVLKKYASTVAEELELRQEWSAYQHKEGVFCGTNELMWTAARTMPAHKWWYEFARGSKKLRAVALRVLSTCMSSGGLERSWSNFDFIHNDKRNKLTPQRANALVSIFSDMKLMRAKARSASQGRDNDTIPWMWREDEEDQQVEEEEEEELVLETEAAATTAEELDMTMSDLD
uniref:DUF659 domain-containing protein n=1 Tax=Chlamydomonas euryale TaxID=1486919 RepID=A0A7R9VUK9_9CHLO